MTLLESALAYNAAGITVMPLAAGSKEPLRTWRALRFGLQTEKDIIDLFKNSEEKNIAVLGGKASNGLTILDFDSIRSYQEAQERWPIIRDLVDTTPNVSTYRGRHIYVKVDGIESVKSYSLRKDYAIDIDVKGEGGYVVAPPSRVNRNGQLFLYDFDGHDLGPIATIAAKDLPFITQATGDVLIPHPDDLIATQYSTYRCSTYGLSALAWAYLQSGTPRAGETRSETEQAIIYHCLATGWTLDQVYELFKRKAAETTHAKEQGPHLFDYIKRCYEKAKKYFHEKSTDRDRQLSLCLEAIQSTYRMEKLTDNITLSLILQKIRFTGKPTVTVSHREFYTQGGATNFHRISKSIVRLRENGLINAQQQIDRRYVFSVNLETLIEKIQPKTNYDTIAKRPLFFSDAFRRGSLGTTGALLVGCLEKAQKENRALTLEEFPMCRQTAEKKLIVLKNHGLIAETLQKTTRRPKKAYSLTAPLTENTLKDIADSLKTSGLYEKRIAKVKQERALHRQSLETPKSGKTA